MEYLAALDAATEPDPNRKSPNVISPSDLSSAWTAKANKRVLFGYGLNYLIDIDNAVNRRRGGNTGTHLRRGRGDRDDDRPHRRPFRSEAEAACSGHGLLHRQVPRLLVKEKRITPHIPATKAFLKSRDERKRVEMRFAHLKTHHGFERLRLRGLSGARDEFHLAA